MMPYLTMDIKLHTSSCKPSTTVNINLDILRKIENDLSFMEKISVIFLMTTNYMTAFDTVIRLYQNYEANSHIISEFVLHNGEKWEDKLLEAIYIIQNREIIRKLDVSLLNLKRLYDCEEGFYSVHVNSVGKCLLSLCEALKEDEAKALIKQVAEDIRSYDSRLEKINLLEIHILYWFKCDYISLFPDRISLQNLFKHLEKFTWLDKVKMDLMRCENLYHMISTDHMLSSLNCTEVTSAPASDIKTIRKGLCIIINQREFNGGEYLIRHGTDIDRDNLESTFKNFHFNVHVEENLNKSEFLKRIENIPKDFGYDYECLFLCILSHGCRGAIITSDEEKVPIEVIEDKLCCSQLENVSKICIIQACQGKNTGRMKSALSSDGGTTAPNTDVEYMQDLCDISRYKNFCVFLSTMQHFVSVRHEKHGSWFIQGLCSVLQEFGSKEGFMECTHKVIRYVQEKRGNIDGDIPIAQVPELKSRLSANFKFSKRTSNA